MKKEELEAELEPVWFIETYFEIKLTNKQKLTLRSKDKDTYYYLKKAETIINHILKMTR